MSEPERSVEDRPPILFYASLALFVVVVALNVYLFRYFFVTAAASASVAILLGPAYGRLCTTLGGRRSVAASIVVVATTVVILLPLVIYAAILGNQAVQLYEWLRPGLETESLQELWNERLPERYEWFRVFKEWVVPDAAKGRIVDMVGPALSQLATGANRIAQRAATGVTAAFLYFILFLLTLFFFLRDGRDLGEELETLLPFSDADRRTIVDRVARTVKGVLYSMVVVPIVQGALAMAGFALFGLPSPLFWGTVLIFAAVIPGVGSPAVWVPASVYLVLTGSPWAGLGLAAYGLLIIGTSDNIIKPLLLRETAQFHPLLAFLAILGGLLTFGLIGFLMGPVVFSLLLSFISIYRSRTEMNRARQPELESGTTSA